VERRGVASGRNYNRLLKRKISRTVSSSHILFVHITPSRPLVGRREMAWAFSVGLLFFFAGGSVGGVWWVPWYSDLSFDLVRNT